MSENAASSISSLVSLVSLRKGRAASGQTEMAVRGFNDEMSHTMYSVSSSGALWWLSNVLSNMTM